MTNSGASARNFTRNWRLLVVLAALIAAVAPSAPTGVERVYSQGFYPAVQVHLTDVSNRFGASLMDALIAALAVAWVVALALDIRRADSSTWLRVAGRTTVRTIVGAAVLYLVFLAIWGLNYRRQPLIAKLRFESGDVSARSAAHFAALTIDRANALHARAHAVLSDPVDWLRSPLATEFARVQHELGASTPAVAGRPKRTLFDWYFRRAAVDGMTDPFFLETLVARDLLPVERPFVVAHEWSHLAGYADESEANFLGWLTCVRAGGEFEYSGWLFLYGEMMRVVSPADAGGLPQLQSGPRADLQAIAARVRRNVSPRLARAGWIVYDRYLKANRIEAGAASYGLVVRLTLGAQFGPGWTPLIRTP
jgi:hypothetical protein